MSKISIVVPVYYNSDTLMMLYEDMKEKILGKLEDYELVFVDDGSGDNPRYIQTVLPKAPHVPRNFGKASHTWYCRPYL